MLLVCQVHEVPLAVTEVPANLARMVFLVYVVLKASEEHEVPLESEACVVRLADQAKMAALVVMANLVEKVHAATKVPKDLLETKATLAKPVLEENPVSKGLKERLETVDSLVLKVHRAQ